jgi:hypothetical protein
MTVECSQDPTRLDGLLYQRGVLCLHLKCLQLQLTVVMGW